MRIKLNLDMKSPQNLVTKIFAKNGFNKWYKLQCFFINKTQNVNNNNFKIVGYQTKCEYFVKILTER